jgi:HAT1-interacting factor 1
MAPLLLAYGKALYELAFSQQGVMGKEEVDKTAEGVSTRKCLRRREGNTDLVAKTKTSTTAEGEEEEEGDEPTGNNFSFAEPAFEGEGEGEGDDAAEEEQEEAGEGGEEDGEADEPEDDYNAAWEVLDVARTIYSKILDEAGLEGQNMREERLRLADTYLALGDVSCETGTYYVQHSLRSEVSGTELTVQRTSLRQ